MGAGLLSIRSHIIIIELYTFIIHITCDKGQGVLVNFGLIKRLLWTDWRMVLECWVWNPERSMTLYIGREEARSWICVKLSHDETTFLCRWLVGHLPVCKWLWMATSFIKREASTITKGWDDEEDDPLPSGIWWWKKIIRGATRNLCAKGTEMSV